jgi:hypothetical protein
MESAHNDARTPLDDTFDAFVKILLQEWRVLGMSVAVIDGVTRRSKDLCESPRWTTPLTESLSPKMQLYSVEILFLSFIVAPRLVISICCYIKVLTALCIPSALTMISPW